MKSNSRRILLISIVTCLSLFKCNTSDTAGIEITNGNSVGTIYNEDSTAAAGALVRLIPSGYDPMAPTATSARPDSTMTDQNGQYLFKVTKSDFYNIIAEKANASCLQDSLALLSDIGNTIENDTLEESGWLAGSIEVKPGGNPGLAVILLPGTNTYTSPFDSLGNFSPLPLPTGHYMVKIFTTENGYDIVDTTVFIPSGDTTELRVRLPASYAPEINDLTLSFDTAAFTATLRWSPSKPLADGAYALHRLVNGVEDTVILLSKATSEYTDAYCMQFYADTLVYKLAAVSGDYKEGYARSTTPIIVCQKAGTVVKTTWSYKDSTSHGGPVCDVHAENINTFYKYWLTQYSCSGELLHELSASYFDTEYPNTKIKNVQADLMDNPIIDISNDRRGVNERTLIKVDNDFNIIKRFAVPDSFFHSRSRREWDLITIPTDGSIFLHYHDIPQLPHRNIDIVNTLSTTIREYDSDFNYLKSYIVDNHFTAKRVFGDTIVGISRQGSLCSLKILDRAFTTLSSYKLTDYKINIVSNNHYIISEHVYSNDDGLPRRTELKLFNKNGEQLGTYIVPHGLGFIYKSIDNIIGYDGIPGKTILYKFNLSFYLEK